MNNVLHLTYSSSLSRLCEVNSSFDSGILRVAYTNRNRNGSYISKETYEKCLDTIYNCPIVCNYNRDTDTIGSHDIDVVTDDDGNMRIVNITTPIGVVPESAKPYWELIEEADGSIHEYLCVDVLLWKRQEAYKKIRDEGINSESMEITVKDGERDKQSGLFIINDFEFTAFCILGDGVEPCFESASLEVFSHTEFKKQMADMMTELRDTFSLVNTPETESDIHPQYRSMEGGKVLEDNLVLTDTGCGVAVGKTNSTIQEVFEAANDNSDVNSEFESCSSDEVTNTAEASCDDNIADVVTENTDVVENNFELAGQFRDNLVRALSEEVVDTCFGEMQRYWYVDYDPDKCEVYCHDEMDWLLYGFTYSMNGDNVVIDFESKKRMKFAIVEFDEGEQASPFASVFAKAVEQFGKNDAQWSEKFNEASETISTLRCELDELDTLRQFKQEAEAERAREAKENVFAQFEDLVGIDAFEALKENCDGIDAEAIEEKCFAIRGRNSTQKFSYETKTPKLKVLKEDYANEPYGGLMLEYGISESK